MIGRTEDGGVPKMRGTAQSEPGAPESPTVSNGWDLPYYWSWYRTVFGERRHFGEFRSKE